MSTNATATVERRFTAQARARVALEERAEGAPKIVGYAAVYYDGTPETEYELWKGVRERIMPGAFDRAIREDDVRGLFNHNPDNLLGRTSAKTLRLTSDKTGLRYENDPGDTTVARDVTEHIRRGDLQGSSFSFRVPPGGQRWVEEGDLEIREILSVELFDAGPVTFPAYETTTTGLRSADGVEARQSYDRWKAARQAETTESARNAASKRIGTRLAQIRS